MGPDYCPWFRRSGGTAILTTRVTQIVRGGALSPGTNAMVSWMRRSRLHEGLASNTQATDPSNEEVTAQVFEEWQTCLAGLCSVP